MRFAFPFAPFLILSLLANGFLPARAQDEAASPVAPPVAVSPAKALTAAERLEARRAQAAVREMRLRAMMNDFGIEAAIQQDALIAYLAEDEAGKTSVRGAARRLIVAVRKGIAPDKMRDLLLSYKASIETDRERRRAAQSALDAKLGFSQSPRLEATLWLLGVLGEGQAGLSLGALAPRATKPAPGEAVGEGAARRGGAVRGVVTRKAEGWIEVRGDGGEVERYSPFWAEGAARTDPATGVPVSKEAAVRADRATLEVLARVQVGDTVRLDWVWNERRRVVRLDILSTESPNSAGQVPANPIPAYPAQ